MSLTTRKFMKVKRKRSKPRPREVPPRRDPRYKDPSLPVIESLKDK